jgi:hypothetical protein
MVATFSLPIASLLFGWGRMSAASLEVIAQWSAIGIWSLLPQALMAVLLTVMATHGRMHVAVWVLAGGLAVLLVAALVGFDRNHAGTHVMWLLNTVFACMAALLLLLERHRMKATLPYVAAALPLLVCAGLVALKPLFFRLNTTAALMLCAVYGLLVLGSAVAASPVLRALLREKVH